MSAMLRLGLVSLLLGTLAGCATPFGDGGDAAPIEDRADNRRPATSPPVAAAPRAPKVATVPAAPAKGAQQRGLRLPDSAAPRGAVPLPSLPPAQPPQFAAIDRAPPSAQSALPPVVPVLPEEPAPSMTPAPAPVEPQPQFSAPVQSLVNAARQSAREGNWDRAQAALERAVKLAPSKSLLWQQLAYTHMHTGQLDRAREVAQRALTLAVADGRENVSAWKLIAEIEHARGNAAAAAAAQANVARLSP